MHSHFVDDITVCVHGCAHLYLYVQVRICDASSLILLDNSCYSRGEGRKLMYWTSVPVTMRYRW